MMNLYEYVEDGLVVGFKTSKSLVDVQRVVTDGRPQKGIDATITAYLPTIDPAQIAADEWYEQHLLVLNSDPKELGKEEPVLDADGSLTYDADDNLITRIGLNAYKAALEVRKELEDANAWLKGLRGVKSAPKRPEFGLTVDQWKNKNINYRTERFNEYVKLSSEAKFEHTVGDILDALIKHAYGDSTELDEIAGKVKEIKTKHPKKK